MTRQTMLWTLLLAVSIGLAAAGGTLSGYTSMETRFAPNGPNLLSLLDLDMGATYSIGSVYVESDGLAVLPGTWVWQGFSAGATFGALSMEANVLFSGYLAEQLYAEATIELPFLGLDFSLHAAHLAAIASVQSGSQIGWALRAAGHIDGVDIESITEFGARIDAGGITIVHAPTGRSRHYFTDPRVVGIGFTGQKLTLSNLSFCGANLNVATYITCANGFEYVRFDVRDLEIETLLWPLTLGVTLEFTPDEKTLAFEPQLKLAETVCVTLFSELLIGGGTMANKLEGLNFMGLELTCQLGPITLREVAVLDQYVLAITTEETGNRVMTVDDILENRYEYYADYWEMLSIAYASTGCCDNDSTFLLNFFFQKNGAQLFDLAIIYAETSVQFNNNVTMSFGTRTTLPGVDYIKFAVDIAF